MAILATLLSLDALSEADRKLYKPAKIAGDDGKEVDGFAFDIEGLEKHPDVGAMARAKGHERARAQQAEDEARKAREELRGYKDQEHERLRGSRKKDEVDALEKSYQGKLEDKDKTIGQLNSSLHRHLVASVARELATDLAVDVDAIPALLPHILPRLTVQVEGDEAQTKVLDSAGKPSAATVEDLRKEILATKSLARLVSGTKANGGSAPGSKAGGSVTPSNIDFNKSPEEIGAALEAKAKTEGKL